MPSQDYDSQLPDSVTAPCRRLSGAVFSAWTTTTTPSLRPCSHRSAHPCRTSPPLPGIGLHLAVRHRAAGPSRALHELFLAAGGETRATTLGTANDHAEGRRVPVLHASAQPPGRGILAGPDRRQLLPVALPLKADPSEIPA